MWVIRTTTLKVILLAVVIGLPAPAAPADVPVKFSDKLYKKFQHPRCLDCHQFYSKQSKGRAYGSHRSRKKCDNCHTKQITGLEPGEWIAPEQEEGMDFTGLSPRETCLFIKRNVAPVEPEAHLFKHMLEDSRILWALESGRVPTGRLPTVPGGFKEWESDLKAWMRDGMICE